MAELNDGLFPGNDLLRHGWNLSGDVRRDRLNSMQITVQQVSGLNLKSTNGDWIAKSDNVHVRMRDRDASRKEMKTGIFGGWDIAD